MPQKYLMPPGLRLLRHMKEGTEAREGRRVKRREVEREGIHSVGRRAFSVAGARVRNALPADVTSAPSLFTFRKRLKLHLFPLSYPGLVL